MPGPALVSGPVAMSPIVELCVSPLQQGLQVRGVSVARVPVRGFSSGCRAACGQGPRCLHPAQVNPLHVARRARRGALVSLAGCCLIVPRAHAQALPAPSQSLGPLVRTTQHRYASVPKVRELRGGVLLVLDIRQRTLERVRLDSDSVTPVSRQGGGPDEFAMPRALLEYGADSTLVWDPLRRQFLVLSPDGRLVRSLRIPESLWNYTPRGADGQGDVYWETSAIQGDLVRDSVSIVRWSPRSGDVDTVLGVDGPDMVRDRRVVRAGGDRTLVTLDLQNPFSRRDEWVVQPGVGLTVARWEPFVIERWSGSGRQQQRSPAIAYARTAVTRADRRLFGQGFRTWPDFKPPFRSGFILLDHLGWLWLELPPTGDTTTHRYLAFDQEGRARLRVSLENGRRVVALGMRSVYVAEPDEDGLYRLAAYRHPGERP